MLARDLGVAHLATGDILRKELGTCSPVGLKAKAFMERGQLVPDEVMVELIREHLVSAERAGGFVLDGFPRTVGQADSLQSMLASASIPLWGVLNLEVAEQSLVERLANRLTCPKDQRTYHPKSHPPRRPGLCDDCGTELVIRKDDGEAVVVERLKVYWKNTAPLIQYYEARGLLRSIDGSGDVDGVASAIKQVVRAVRDGRATGMMRGDAEGGAGRP